MKVAALDIGGANIKAAGPGDTALTRPFELWRQPRGLAGQVERILAVLDGPLDLVAVTMTGELCDCFETKAEGVRRILESAEHARRVASPGSELLIWRTDFQSASRKFPWPSLSHSSSMSSKSLATYRSGAPSPVRSMSLASRPNDSGSALSGLPAASRKRDDVSGTRTKRPPTLR